MEEQKKGSGFRFSHNAKRNIIIIVMVLAAILVIRPIYTSYASYAVEQKCGEQTVELSSELSAVKASLEENKAFKEELYTENKELNMELRDYVDLAASLNSSLLLLRRDLAEEIGRQKEIVSERVDELEEEITSLQEELVALQADYNILVGEDDIFVDNVAHSICCKKKFDNPRISYYLVRDSNLYCLEESGEGTYELDCSFG
jgi:regulator of replication initiation timing